MSQILQAMTQDILNIRPPKQPVDQIVKTVLFIRSRKSLIHPNDFMKTPSVEFNNIQPLDELLARGRVVEFARMLVEFLANERTRYGQYDEIFATLKSQILYTANNFINGYYNSHDINLIDPMDLAITCVFLSCKTNSTFKRLEKVILAAKNCFRIEKKANRKYFSHIEMMILQSIGFELTVADDIPHRYIYQFMPVMRERYESFKSRDREMKTLCSIALTFANNLITTTPIMINRESCVIAAACIYISNSFKSILNIEKWWKNIAGCENLPEKHLLDTADLLYDLIKYSQNNWCLAQSSLSPQSISHISSPSSTYSTSGVGSSNGSSPLQPNLTSPLTKLNCINKMSTVNKLTNNTANTTNINNWETFSDSGSSNSAKSELTASKSSFSDYSLSNSFHEVNSFSKPEKIPNDQKSFITKRRSSLTINQYRNCYNNLQKPSPLTCGNICEEKEKIIPKILNSTIIHSSKGSPRPNVNKNVINIPSNSETILTNVVKYNHHSNKSHNSQKNEQKNESTQEKYLNIEKIKDERGNFVTKLKNRKDKKSHKLHKKEKLSRANSREKSNNRNLIKHNKDSIESKLIVPSSQANLTYTQSNTEPVHIRHVSSRSSNSSISSVTSEVSNTSATLISTSTCSNLKKHPLELNFMNRKEAIIKNQEVATFYARSKDRYCSLSRSEKDIVKKWVKTIKSKNISKSFLDTPGKNNSLSNKRKLGDASSNFEEELDESDSGLCTTPVKRRQII